MDFPAKALDDKTAARHALHAMMASNCYHEKNKLYFPIEKWNWLLVDTDGEPTDKPTKDGFITGFAYDIYEHQDSNQSVIAFRGSDSVKDYVLSNGAIGFSIPYKSARKAVRKFMQKFPERNLTLVGHSLGGGFALGASCHHGVPAVTFNPSPRIFDGLGDHHEQASRVCVYQNGDTLTNIRTIWQQKFLAVVKSDDLYESHFPYGGKHDSDLLAEEMRLLGMKINPRLGELKGIDRRAISAAQGQG